MIEYLKNNGIAVVSGNEKVITDANSALDLAMSIKYEGNTEKIVIDKNVVSEDFFVLSTGIAGEILQKFVNYHVKAAIYGDFSKYTSKPLKDFIYESNNGSDFFFEETREAAVKRLMQTQ